jgi:hypothetical protein
MKCPQGVQASVLSLKLEITRLPTPNAKEGYVPSTTENPFNSVTYIAFVS